MSLSGPQRLYELLPLIHRALDEQRGGPLRALLGVMGEEYERLHADIGQLYDDWFIETCEEQLVPYIGELVGVPVEQLTGAPEYLLRARVANALRHRRRKGLPTTLREVIWETCHWNAVVLESFQYLAATQHLEHVHLTHGRAVDVRRGAPTLLAPGGARTGHLADVRGGGDTVGPRGLFNTFHVGLLLSRMQAYPVEYSEPGRVGEGRYTFHSLGQDTHLFTLLRRERRPLLPPSLEMPLPLTPGRLEADVTRARALLETHELLTPESHLEGHEPYLAVYRDDTPVPMVDLVAQDLKDWQRPGPSLVGLRSGHPRLDSLSHHVELQVWMGDEGPHLLHLHHHATDSLSTLAAALEAALHHASPRAAFAQARVLPSGAHLLVLPGEPLEGPHPVRFAPGPRDAESAHALGLTPKHARRVAVLVSHELPPATGETRQGRLRLRLGEHASMTLSVPLGESPKGMAHELRRQFPAHEGWHALSHGDLLFILVEAPQDTAYLRTEEDPEDSLTARRLGLSPRVAVDVKRGRLAFSLGEDTEERKPRVSWAFGRATDLGAGPYPRPDADASIEATRPAWRAEVCKQAPSTWTEEPGTTRFHTLFEALAAWAHQPPGTHGLILLLDSATYAPSPDQASFPIHMRKGSTLRVEAAEGELPTLDGMLLANELTEHAEHALPQGTYTVRAKNEVDAELTLNGLQLRGLEVRGSLSLTVSHCTMHGPLHAPHATNAFLDVQLRGSLLGPVYLPGHTSRLEVSDCVLHGEEGRPALGGEDTRSPGPSTRLTRTTVLGSVHVESLSLAEDCLFTHDVEVHHVQTSMLRYCALPWASRNLPRHRCLLFSAPLEATGGAPGEATIASSPEFVSLSPGEPGYARLADVGPEELRNGAREGGEFGVYHPLQEERRLTALRGVLEEYLPAGLSAGVFFID